MIKGQDMKTRTMKGKGVGRMKDYVHMYIIAGSQIQSCFHDQLFHVNLAGVTHSCYPSCYPNH